MSRRLADLALALPAALVALPLALVAAFMVRASLGAPILFRQQRAGLGGRPFTLLKFRTMRPPAPGADPLADDEARTPAVGRFLRRTRLDELPQLWNVIRGDMGVVGPRPLLPVTVAAMGPAGIRRGSLRPGLTGWAQVHGGPELDPDDRLAYDLWYVGNASIGLDLSILVRTFAVILLGDRVIPRQVEHAHAGRDHRRG
jgi:lipopolysaccharide/colanic/teichoic acid biosynthesis glycosyltransferase